MSKPVYVVFTPFFPAENNFRGSFIHDQLVAIRKQIDADIEIIKLVPFQMSIADEYMFDGFRCTCFGVIDIPGYFLPGILSFLNIYRLKKELQRIVGKRKVTVIHSHSTYPGGFLAQKIAHYVNSRFFIQHHGLDILGVTSGQYLKGALRGINIRYLKQCIAPVLRKSALNICVSQKVMHEVVRVMPVCQQTSYVLYNGVDSSKFYKTDEKKDNRLFTIGCIGNFIPIKDQLTLLMALNHIKLGHKNKQIRTVFIGTGPTRNRCEQFTEDNNLEHVEFIDAVEHSKLNAVYNSLDLFILPSYYEALGCVYMEALQAGIPVVGIKGMGIEEVLHDTDRHYSLIEKGDFERLAEIILFRMENKAFVSYDFNIDNYIKSFIAYCDTKKLLHLG